MSEDAMMWFFTLNIFFPGFFLVMFFPFSYIFHAVVMNSAAGEYINYIKSVAASIDEEDAAIFALVAEIEEEEAEEDMAAETSRLVRRYADFDATPDDPPPVPEDEVDLFDYLSELDPSLFEADDEASGGEPEPVPEVEPEPEPVVEIPMVEAPVVEPVPVAVPQSKVFAKHRQIISNRAEPPLSRM